MNQRRTVSRNIDAIVQRELDRHDGVVRCPTCKGSGVICSTCGGKRFVSREAATIALEAIEE